MTGLADWQTLVKHVSLHQVTTAHILKLNCRTRMGIVGVLYDL